MAGKKMEYVQEPPQEYFCPVSFELMINAQQTSCCGHHLSEEVAKNLESNNKACPMCNSPNLNTHKDLYFRRQVAQVQVFCSKKSSGCTWEGVVTDLTKHLSYNSIGSESDCRYVEVLCPYVCGSRITRKKLQRHMQEDCPKRSYKCNYCNEEGTYGFIINSHLSTCPQFPTKCPKNCDNLLRREEVKDHLATKCPNVEISCKFSYTGCNKGICRKDMKKHMDENTQTHLNLLGAYSRKKDKEIEALKAQVMLLTNTLTRHFHSSQHLVASNTADIGFVPPPIMVFNNFSESSSNKKKWRSFGFYSHVGGYKMCLLVYPNSQVDSTGNQQMGVYLQMLHGEYDDHLDWPFYGKVVVRLVNQGSGEGSHIDHILLDATSYKSSKFSISMVDRVTGIDSKSCWGCVNFVSMKTVEDKSNNRVQYLREDRLIFQVLKVNLLNAEDCVH